MKTKPLLPLLPVFLVLAWLLLNDRWEVGTLLLGVLFAGLITWAVARLRPLPAWPRRLSVAIGLLGYVVWDITRSNLAVTHLIFGHSQRKPNSGFIYISLKLRDPHGLAILSMIITATPGTVWSNYDRNADLVTIHVLDIQNESEWIDMVKQRYERPLMEIFE